MSKQTMKDAVETIERLMNGLSWFHDKYPEDHSEYDEEEFKNARKTIKALEAEISEDTVTLVGVKDGVETNLGTVTTPPRMKLREIVRGYFGDDPEDDMSDAYMACCVGEDFLIWLMKNGWKSGEMVVTKPKVSETTKKSVEEVLEQIARGTCDPTPTRRIYFDNPDAMKLDVWWQDYFTNNDKTVKMLAKHAIELLKSK